MTTFIFACVMDISVRARTASFIYNFAIIIKAVAQWIPLFKIVSIRKYLISWTTSYHYQLQVQHLHVLHLHHPATVFFLTCQSQLNLAGRYQSTE